MAPFLNDNKQVAALLCQKSYEIDIFSASQ